MFYNFYLVYGFILFQC